MHFWVDILIMLYIILFGFGTARLYRRMAWKLFIKSCSDSAAEIVFSSPNNNLSAA